MQISILVIILIITTLLYVTRWIAIESTAILTIVALVFTGILKPDQAFAGFSNAGMVTVAAMFVLSSGLVRTGALESVTFQLARYSQGSPRRLLLLLAGTLPPVSAVMNNTPIVVMMLPVVVSLSRRFKLNPSKLLLPVSYFAILGGTITLLGTSTNILVDDIYRQSGGPGFSLFDFAPLGLIYCARCDFAGDADEDAACCAGYGWGIIDDPYPLSAPRGGPALPRFCIAPFPLHCPVLKQVNKIPFSGRLPLWVLHDCGTCFLFF